MKEGRYDKLKNINERLVLKNKFVEQLSNEDLLNELKKMMVVE